MSKSVKNKRCPLQRECGRSCQHEYKELECDYYRNNAYGDNVIAEQELLRELKARADAKAMDELLMDEIGENELVYLPLDKLHPHPDNPRKNLGDLTELADSIRSKGVMQNLTVVKGHFMTLDEYITVCKAEGVTKDVAKNMYSRENAYVDDGYTVIIGHRRSAAAKMAGLTELPCIIVEMSPQEQVATMLLENMQRSDLNAYEQAQGFQMMMDFGENVESIAKKTGFSTTTVKRRLKIAELDQTVLKEVSTDRQITIGDLDRLAQIEDIEARNTVLKDIGTSNFNQRVAEKLKQQALQKKLPAVMAAVKALKGKKLERHETWHAIYTSIGETVDILKWDETEPLISGVPAGMKLYYFLDENYGTIRFYKDTPKEKPVRRPQEEIDREKYIADVREKLDALSETAAQLRLDFVTGLSMTTKNADKMMSGALATMTISMLTWVPSPDKKLVTDKMGMEWDYGHADESRAKFLSTLSEDPSPYVPLMIYENFGVRQDTKYYSGYKREFPKHEQNMRLDFCYDWLCSIGYEMSDDERGLRDGTHPLFIDKDKKGE